MSGKSQMIGDFTFFRPSQILPIYQIYARGLSQIFPIMNYLFVKGGTGAQQLRGLVCAKSFADGCWCPGRYKFEFSFVGNDRRPSRKSGTRRENRKAPDSPELSPFIPDDRVYLRFRIFISRRKLLVKNLSNLLGTRVRLTAVTVNDCVYLYVFGLITSSLWERKL